MSTYTMSSTRSPRVSAFQHLYGLQLQNQHAAPFRCRTSIPRLPSYMERQRSKSSVTRFQNGTHRVMDVMPQFSVDGTVRAVVTVSDRIAWTADHDGCIRVRNIPKGNDIRTLEGRDGSFCTCLVHVEKMNTVWTAFSDGVIRVYDANTYRLQGEFMRHDKAVECMINIAEHVYTGGRDWQIYQLRADNYSHGRHFSGHSNAVRCFCSYSGCTDPILLSGADDGTVRVWDLNGSPRNAPGDSGCIHVFEGHVQGVLSLEVVAASSQLWSGGEDTTVRVWNLRSLQCLGTFSGHGAPVNCLRFVEHRMWSGDKHGQILLWDVKSLTPLQEISSRIRFEATPILDICKVRKTVSWKVWTTCAGGKIHCWNVDSIPIVFTASDGMDDAAHGDGFGVVDHAEFGEDLPSSVDKSKKSLDSGRLGTVVRGRERLSPMKTSVSARPPPMRSRSGGRQLNMAQSCRAGREGRPTARSGSVTRGRSHSRKAQGAGPPSRARSTQARSNSADGRGVMSFHKRQFSGEAWKEVIAYDANLLADLFCHELGVALDVPVTKLHNVAVSLPEESPGLTISLDVEHDAEITATEIDNAIQACPFSRVKEFYRSALAAPETSGGSDIQHSQTKSREGSVMLNGASSVNGRSVPGDCKTLQCSPRQWGNAKEGYVGKGDGMESRVKSLKAQHEAELAQKDRDLHKALGRVRQLEKELAHLKDTVEAGHSKLTSPKRATDKSRKAGENSREERSGLQREIFHLKKNKTSLQQETDALRKERLALQKEMKALREQFTKLQRETDIIRKEKTVLHKDADTTNKDKMALTKEVKAMKEEHNKLQKEADVIKKNHSKMLDETEALRDEHRQLQEDAQVLQEENAHLLHDLERLRGMIEEAQLQEEALKIKQEEENRRAASVSREAESEVQKYQQQIQELEKSLQEETKVHKEKTDQLKRDVHKYRDEARALRDEHAKVQEENTQLRSELERMKAVSEESRRAASASREVESEVQKYQEQIQDLEKSLQEETKARKEKTDQLKRDVHKYRSLADSLKEEQNRLQDESRALKEQHTKLQQDARTRQEENMILRRDLELLKAMLEETQMQENNDAPNDEIAESEVQKYQQQIQELEKSLQEETKARKEKTDQLKRDVHKYRDEARALREKQQTLQEDLRLVQEVNEKLQEELMRISAKEAQLQKEALKIKQEEESRRAASVGREAESEVQKYQEQIQELGKSLQEETKARKEKTDQLKRDVHKYRDEARALRDEHAKVQEENTQLKKELDDIRAVLKDPQLLEEHLMSTNNEAYYNIQKDRELSNALKDEHERLHSETKELKDEHAKLQEENAQLRKELDHLKVLRAGEREASMSNGLMGEEELVEMLTDDLELCDGNTASDIERRQAVMQKLRRYADMLRKKCIFLQEDAKLLRDENEKMHELLAGANTPRGSRRVSDVFDFPSNEVGCRIISRMARLVREAAEKDLRLQKYRQRIKDLEAEQGLSPGGIENGLASGRISEDPSEYHRAEAERLRSLSDSLMDDYARLQRDTAQLRDENKKLRERLSHLCKTSERCLESLKVAFNGKISAREALVARMESAIEQLQSARRARRSSECPTALRSGDAQSSPRPLFPRPRTASVSLPRSIANGDSQYLDSARGGRANPQGIDCDEEASQPGSMQNLPPDFLLALEEIVTSMTTGVNDAIQRLNCVGLDSASLRSQLHTIARRSANISPIPPADEQ